MRKLAVLALVLLLSIQSFAASQAAKKITVEQLEQTIAGAHRKSDKQLAHEIANLQLTERMSHSRFRSLDAALPGERSKTALLPVADASAFLEAPGSEVLQDPMPDIKHQGDILIEAAKFVKAESKRMPNFLAHRTTTRFHNAVTYPYSTRIRYFTPDEFHLFDSRTVSLRYIDGKEEEAEPQHRLRREGDILQSPPGLTTWGAFGVLPDTVMSDILQSKVGWDHWERSGAERLAVFRFLVPKEKSHYMVEYCCSFGPKREMTVFEATPTYHGEIAIDPATGHVLRIVVICDLAPGQVISRADVELEYGQVEIAGKSYFLPLRGVSASTVTTSNSALNGWGQGDRFTLTSINDLQFGDYRVFRTEMKILPAEPADKTTN